MTFTLEEIRRAAAEKGAEPVYTQAMWREMVRTLLAKIDRIEMVVDFATAATSASQAPAQRSQA